MSLMSSLRSRWPGSSLNVTLVCVAWAWVLGIGLWINGWALSLLGQAPSPDPIWFWALLVVILAAATVLGLRQHVGLAALLSWAALAMALFPKLALLGYIPAVLVFAITAQLTHRPPRAAGKSLRSAGAR